MKKYKVLISLLLAILFIFSAVGCVANDTARTNASDTKAEEATASESPVAEIDYSDRENWAYYESKKTEYKADVFFICPTVYGGGDSLNMSLSDEKTMSSFLGATNMEKGIYDDECRFFAPYYRQMGLSGYTQSSDISKEGLSYAYEDVKDAFLYYLENENNGNPIIIAGFSQGADHSIRLLKDVFADRDINDLLIACYAIGWRITEEELAEYPHLKFAEGESDTGVIIAFNSESEAVEDSLMIPKGTKTMCINPLNWKTDSTLADKSLNIGACFTGYDGSISREIPKLTGCYIDEVRGALKVIDVTPEEYPPGIDIFPEGVYHFYDYQFFYRNLEENVTQRINAFYS